MDWKREYKREHRASWEDIAQTIHDTVTMNEVLDVYAPGIPRRNHRMPCPIHEGKDPNFSYTRNGYKCFVCGASGDVISFVKDSLGLATRSDAIRRLNEDLRLNLPINTALNAEQSTEISRRREEAERKRKAEKAWWDQYHMLLDEWIECDKTKRTSSPLSDEWCNAVRRLEYIGYLLDGLPPEPR